MGDLTNFEKTSILKYPSLCQILLAESDKVKLWVIAMNDVESVGGFPSHRGYGGGKEGGAPTALPCHCQPTTSTATYASRMQFQMHRASKTQPTPRHFCGIKLSYEHPTSTLGPRNAIEWPPNGLGPWRYGYGRRRGEISPRVHHEF